MRTGYLSEYFDGVAAKRLSAVEADRTRSNQHEYQATSRMLAFMGRPSEKTRINARFLYLSDEDTEPLVSQAYLTLYDSRKGKPNRSPEYRFYFPTTPVSEKASTDDLLVIAKMRSGDILVLIAASESSYCNQIQWLFGLSGFESPGFVINTSLESEGNRIALTSGLILETIGVVMVPATDSHLDIMLEKFGGTFPETRVFSDFARSVAATEHMDPATEMDALLMAWMEQEETLFRILEHKLVSDRLAMGFDLENENGPDVNEFISFSLSVQNRRKSRVGLALENHLEHLFHKRGLQFDRGKVTENRSKPDFIFPGIRQYLDPNFNPLQLTMLGVKSTCKDRWRQVLSEARRVGHKHLFTLEAAISTNQTDEMNSQNLRLVIPKALHPTYLPVQRERLMSLSDFSTLVMERQPA